MDPEIGVPDIDEKLLFETFWGEAEEILADVEQDVLILESKGHDEEVIQRLFRRVHTLKGNAGYVGLQSLGEFAHALEDALDGLRQGTIPASAAVVSLLLAALDALRVIGQNEGSGERRIEPRHRELMDALRRVAGQARARASASTRAGAEGTKIETDGSLRVALRRLDQMVDLVGEMAIARGKLGQIIATVGGSVGRRLLEVHRETERLALDLQELVMLVRMVPLGRVFRPFTRVVRDLAAREGKQIQLTIEGADVEVDTTVVDHVRDPLTHLVRNAIDHGIESPEERMAAGKPPMANLILRAFHEAGTVVIEIEDDGRGLDEEAVLARGRSRGLLPEGRVSREELFRVILEPGFSTAEAVTDLSGRGVGLDVVRRNVEALRGSVLVESEQGKGLKLTLRFPLTLAIISGFGVGIGDDRYVLPVDSVVECLDRPSGASTAGPGVFTLRDHLLPCLDLRHYFDLSGSVPHRQSIVVIGDGRPEAGLIVDRLFGEVEAVIKPLGRLQGVPGLAGATILGDGRVALVLDPSALLRIVRRRGEETPHRLAAEVGEAHARAATGGESD